MSKILGKPQPDSDVVNKQPRVVIVGVGWVGQYCHKLFTKADLIQSTGFVKQNYAHYDLGIIAVPTPMNPKTGRCDTSIVEECVMKYKHCIDYFLIKSTVEIGTTDYLKEKYKVNIAMSPEYIGETLAHPMVEPKRDFFQIIGADEKTANKIAEFWRMVLHADAPIFLCTAKEAEIIKYCENYWIMRRVDYWNDVYEVAQTFKQSFDRIREGLVLDPRLNRTHSFVYPKNRGWSGKCLIGDTFVGGYKKLKDLHLAEGAGYGIVIDKSERVVNKTIKVDSRGRIIHGSLDHIHFVYENNKLKEKRLNEIKIEDWFFVPVPEKIQKIERVVVGDRPNGVHFWLIDFDIDNNFARLMGLYLAEGCTYKKEYSIIWSFGESEEKLANEVVKILKKMGLNSYKRLQISNGTYGISRCWIVRVRSMWLFKVFENLGLGNNSLDKSTEIYCGAFAENLIGGWLDGDGCYYGGTIEGYSESKVLIHRIDRMLLSLGINAVIGNGGKKIRISRRNDVKRVSKWCERFNFNVKNYVRKNSYASPTCKRVKGGWITKIKSIQIIDEPRKVYAIETTTGKYVANNILTHNCLPKDMNALAYTMRKKGNFLGTLQHLIRKNARKWRKGYKDKTKLIPDENTLPGPQGKQ